MKVSLGRAVRSLFGSFRLEMSFKSITVLVVGLERKELIQERYLASKREEQENKFAGWCRRMVSIITLEILDFPSVPLKQSIIQMQTY